MDKLLENLEYDKVLDMIAGYAVSDVTKADFRNLIFPKKCAKEAEILLDQVDEAYRVYHSQNLRPVTSFEGISTVAAKSKVAAMLSPAELGRVLRLLAAGRIAKTNINSATGADLLKQIVGGYTGDNALEKDLDAAILSDTEISDNASPALKEIRKKLSNARAKLSDKIKKYSQGSEVSKFLQGDLVTVREGRYVLPVKSEYRSSVQGLIHDRSSTGATVFIEPFAIVEMNNQIRTLLMEEQQEIERILQLLTARVALVADDLLATQTALILLDTIFAKMHFASDYGCTRPILNDSGILRLTDCRHPLIDRAKVVPVTLELGKDFRILTVTGPNTGGKTVALKTAGLFCLLAASGVFLPAAEGSEAAVFDNVFSDIGDQQSIESSLSTFSSHIKNFVYILENVTRNSLVLFDELGGGTDPEEGAALAIGILKYLERVGCCGIITTHYGQLKEYSLASSNIQNASMQFDNVTLRPTYRLVAGLPGTSNALKIAGTLGIKKEIIDEAYSCLPKQRVDLETALLAAQQAKNTALAELEVIKQQRSEIESLKKEIEIEKAQIKERQQSIKENAKSEVRRIAANCAETAAQLIDEIKEKLKSADEKALLDAKRLHKKIENIGYSLAEDTAQQLSPISPAKIKAGAEVIIISLGARGTVVSVNPAKKEAAVRAGAAVANIKFDNLAECKSDKPKAARKSNIAAVAPETHEINVIGLTVAEALEQVDALILSVTGGNIGGASGSILRIIHGKGTGALGKGIQQYLRNLKSVASYRFGRYGEGETGVTVVELK